VELFRIQLSKLWSISHAPQSTLSWSSLEGCDILNNRNNRRFGCFSMIEEYSIKTQGQPQRALTKEGEVRAAAEMG
jgi:hypothetical protein